MADTDPITHFFEDLYLHVSVNWHTAASVNVSSRNIGNVVR
jgi:hypothetical protein